MKIVPVIALVSLAAMRESSGPVRPSPSCSLRLVTERVDTLRSEKGYPLADPIYAGTDAAGSVVVADRSEKSLFVFPKSGSARRLGGVGTEEGEFITVLGAAVLGDAVLGYDFNSSSVTQFRGTEPPKRRPLSGETRFRARTLRPVDDSLLLVVDYPAGQPEQPVLRIKTRDFEDRARFWSLRRYFARTPAFFIGFSQPHADAAFGLVAAGVVGGDSVHFFDYRGTPLGDGDLRDEFGKPVQSIEALARANRDSAFYRGTGKFVGEGIENFAGIVVMSPDLAVVQVSKPAPDGLMRRDMNDTSLFAVVQLDARTHRARTVAAARIAGTLVGRPAGKPGRAWIIRTTAHRAEDAELLTVTLQKAGSCQ